MMKEFNKKNIFYSYYVDNWSRDKEREEGEEENWNDKYDVRCEKLV